MKHKEQSQQALQTLGGLAKKHEITHEQIAELVGVRRQSISQMLSGKFYPTLDNVFKILNAVNELSGENYDIYFISNPR
jgi:transcriptional regulator with XRE-family HTH domain